MRNRLLLALACFAIFLAGCTLPRAGCQTGTYWDAGIGACTDGVNNFAPNCPGGTAWDNALACCRQSAGTGPCFENSTGAAVMLWEDWQTVAVIVIITGFILMGLLYMIAYGFGYKALEIFVKNEMIQLAASAIIIGSVVVFITVMEEYSQQFAGNILALHGGGSGTPGEAFRAPATGIWTIRIIGRNINVTEQDMSRGYWNGRWSIVEKGPYPPATEDTITCPAPCHFYLARSYLGYNYERIVGVARQVVKMYATLTWLDYVSEGFFINVMGVVFGIQISTQPFTGLSIIYHSLGTCFEFMVKAMMSIKFQEMALLYIQNGVFPIFLIGGVILRSIWFLRKLGGLMIAIAIATYTLFPLLYVLAWYTIDSSTMTMQINADLVPSGVIRTPLLPFGRTNLDIEDDEFKDLLFTHYNEADDPATPYDDREEPASVGLLDLSAGLLLPALALPLLNIFITIAFIKTLSAALGGDIEIAGLTRIL